MSATAYAYGHPIVYADGAWRYADTGEAIDGAAPRLCPACQLPPTPEGYDPCLGFIPGATSACCGHGVQEPFVVCGSSDAAPATPATPEPARAR
ncbi:hypothetical protein [Longimicrobium sp.]|jgi:hypothetical protein|uniref:hypothetical protein n=1 Tax=Longimicrobium sp. TaxID=2029185 RepID=UPI002F948A30